MEVNTKIPIDISEARLLLCAGGLSVCSTY